MVKPNEETAAEISRRMDDLAREYQSKPRGHPRRQQIADEISALSLKLQALHKQPSRE
jgi:hypothetical protein